MCFLSVDQAVVKRDTLPHLVEGSVRKEPGRRIFGSIWEPVSGSMEREVHLDRLHIDFRHKGDFAEVALPLAVLVLQDVALALFTAQHFTRRSDFESFGDSFSRLGDASIFGHRGAEAR